MVWSRMTQKGHEERFPPTRLSAGCGFRKETLAGMRRNGRDAPIPDLPALTPERAGSVRTELLRMLISSSRQFVEQRLSLFRSGVSTPSVNQP